MDESLSLLPPHPYSNTSKRQSKRIDESPALRFSFLLHSLEDLAAQKGESGLVISLSKPFQRLLKYPLLFQNLLFNTDPSLKEYEATLAMVDEVELIVRSIEDEKSSSEEREKTRDVWARIEGLEKDKVGVSVSSDCLPASLGQAALIIIRSSWHQRQIACSSAKPSFHRSTQRTKSKMADSESRSNVSATFCPARIITISGLCEFFSWKLPTPRRKMS